MAEAETTTEEMSAEEEEEELHVIEEEGSKSNWHMEILYFLFISF